MAKNNEDIVCKCGHKHSDHNPITSHNYSAGKCKLCSCIGFVHNPEMTCLDIFRSEFKSIVYQNAKISDSKLLIAKYGCYNKNGSHDKAILKEIDTLQRLRKELHVKLKGMSYDEWKEKSKRLSLLNSKVNLIKSKIIKLGNDGAKYETEINNLLNF